VAEPVEATDAGSTPGLFDGLTFLLLCMHRPMGASSFDELRGPSMQGYIAARSA
jgi:hypothetical protein